MKKFTTLLLAILLVLPAMAASIPAGTKLYLTPNSNWKVDGARFAAYFFGNGDCWASMTAVAGETDLYEVEVPAPGNFTNVIFCRMNPGAAENNWNNKWNQTGDLIYDGSLNHYTVAEGAWDKGDGTWSYYGTSVEVMVTLSYAPSGRILENNVITFSPNVVNSEEPATIYVDDEAINGVAWTATAGEHTAYAEAAGVKSDVVNIVVEAITTQFNVYLKKPAGWDTANIYFWDNGFECAWPGKPMIATQVDGVDYFYYTFYNTETVGVLFNNGSEPIEQTVDIDGVTGEMFYELGDKNAEGKYEFAIPAIDDITYGVYCLDLGEIDWKAADAWFSAYFYNSSNTEIFTWVRGVVDENRVYFGLEDKENTYTHVVFARFNPAATEESWDDTADDGDAQDLWNKTNNIAYKKPANGTAVYQLTDWNTVILTDEFVVPTGVNRVELADAIGYAYGVVSAEGAIEVYNVNGAVVARGNDNVDLRGLGRGVYIIRNGNQVRKVVR